MTAEEFIKSQKEILDNLEKRYAEIFGEESPDLSDASFWGSEIDLLKDSIDTGVPINVSKLAQDADL